MKNPTIQYENCLHVLKAVMRLFFREIYRTRHEHAIHDPNCQKFQCRVAGCEKIFNYLSNRNRHEVSHLNPKAKCPECKRIFAKGGITVHLKIHTTRSCDLCDFTRHLQAYKNHMTSHTNPELLNCQHCNIFCKDKQILNRHLKKYHQIPFENDDKSITYNDPNDKIICKSGEIAIFVKNPKI